MPAAATDRFESLTAQVIAFRDDRDWKQFHDPKDVAIALSLEASEYLELYQWKPTGESGTVSRDRAGEELADVLYWVLLAAHDLEIDLPTALAQKLVQNRDKYPVAKARGNATKYTEL